MEPVDPKVASSHTFDRLHRAALEALAALRKGDAAFAAATLAAALEGKTEGGK
jgi:hypothetical protein